MRELDERLGFCELIVQHRRTPVGRVRNLASPTCCGHRCKRERKRRQMGYIGSQPKGKRKIPVTMISAKPSCLILSLLAAISILGCGGVSSSPVTTTASPLTGSSLSGQVKSGQQPSVQQQSDPQPFVQEPISGATIQLYQVGTAADGSSAAPLGSSTTTNSSGGFTITGDYTCPGSNPLVYLLATGGIPAPASATNNPAISLIAALGPCTSLTPTTSIELNEVTTVAAVAALWSKRQPVASPAAPPPAAPAAPAVPAPPPKPAAPAAPEALLRSPPPIQAAPPSAPPLAATAATAVLTAVQAAAAVRERSLPGVTVAPPAAPSPAAPVATAATGVSADTVTGPKSPP